MRYGRRIVGMTVAFCIGTLGMAPLAAAAQGAVDAWQWRASIYGWFPGIAGDTQFPSGASGPSIDASTGDVLSALKFTVMGAFEGRRGDWGFFTDVIYVDLGGSKSGSRDFEVGRVGLPAGVDVDANLDIKAWIWTLAGSYSLSSTPQNTTQMLFGTRMLNMNQTLDWSLNGDIGSTKLPGRSGRSEAEGTNWDAIVGVKGVAALGAKRRWVLPYYVDAGAGESQLTWQALAGVGYSFKWGTTTLGWRYLDYEMKSDSAIDNINFSGPYMGVTFVW